MKTTTYKQTEIGLIPEDWELVSFNKIFTYYSTSNYSKAQMTDEGDVGCIHYGLIHAISNSNYNLNNGVKYYVSLDKAKYEFVNDGDVIMVDASEDLEGINKSVEIKGINNKKYISGLHTYLLRDKNLLLASGFRGIVLNSNVVKKQMLQLAVGMKVFGVSKSQLNNIQIPLPPLPEQTAIAEALSDADTWIESLEQLIAKKRLLKQGAMQTLLTPKENWEVKKLGEMINLITKGTTPTSIGKDFVDSGINFIKIESITKNGRIDITKVAFIDENTHEILSRSKIQENDILFSIAGALGRTAIVKKEILPANTNQALGIIRLRENTLDRVFLYYFFNTSEFQQMLNTISVTGAQPNLSLFNLNEFEISFPKSKEEQTHIATILSDMDVELEALEAQLEKAKQMKQGMMQELLTGRVRLV